MLVSCKTIGSVLHSINSIPYWSHLSSNGEYTCFAGTATVNRSPHRHSTRRWLEAPTGSSITKKLAATSGRRHWPICWCCLDRGPGSFDVEDATTLSWSSAAVSQWVHWNELQFAYYLFTNENCRNSINIFIKTSLSMSTQWKYVQHTIRA